MSFDPGFQNIPDEQVNSYLINAGAHKPGINHFEVTEYYDKWASQYENDLNERVYRGPHILADFCNILLSDKNAKILDVGAGTGLVGEHLKKRGFCNLDALEPSVGMLEVAKTKNVYISLHSDRIDPMEPTSLPAESYDAVVLAGALGEGHIPTEGIRELARLTKPKGYIVIVMRKEYLSYVSDYKGKLEPFMDKLVNEKVWKKLIRLEVENYSFNKTGIVFLFQKE